MSSTLPEPGDEIALPRRDYAGHDSVFCDELATVGWFSHSVTQHRKDLVGYGILQPTFRTSSCSIFFCKENLTLNPPRQIQFLSTPISMSSCAAPIRPMQVLDHEHSSILVKTEMWSCYHHKFSVLVYSSMKHRLSA